MTKDYLLHQSCEKYIQEDILVSLMILGLAILCRPVMTVGTTTIELESLMKG